jgi:arylsulfatase A-like enzyme
VEVEVEVNTVSLSDLPPTAVARAGPMDGRALGPASTAEYEITMADDSKWVYRRTATTQTHPDGSRTVMYDCEGRS